MTLAMSCQIIFLENSRRKEIVLTQVTEIIVESSWQLLTATAEIVLPRKVTFFDKHNVRDTFRQGDYVVIYFGYDGNNVEEFRGYITEVAADIPIRIKLQDEMWLLKKSPVNFSHPNISLKKLLHTIAPQYSIDALEGIQIGSVRFPKTTVAAVLEKLQQDPWNLNTFFRVINGRTILICGKRHAGSYAVPTFFHLERSCVSSALNYVRGDDIAVIVKGVSTLNGGTKIEVEFGENNGQQKQITHYNKTKKELTILVKREYSKYKEDRFEGSFTAFGIPSIQHGEKAILVSSLYEDRNGTYFIEGVTKTFNRDGIRQVIQLDQKVG